MEEGERREKGDRSQSGESVLCGSVDRKVVRTCMDVVREAENESEVREGKEECERGGKR